MRLGALLQLAYEVYDTLENLYKRYIKENGEKENPTSYIMIRLMHHCLSCTLVIPMNIYNPKSLFYCEMVTVLSGAAGCAIWNGVIGDTFDTTTLDGLHKMVITSTIG